MQSHLHGRGPPAGILDAAAIRTTLPGVADRLAGQPVCRQLGAQVIRHRLWDAREDRLEVVLQHSRSRMYSTCPCSVVLSNDI